LQKKYLILDELQKILEAAELLFRRYGVRSVTMSDIATQLGMSKKTLYQHIENKNDLVEKIMLLYINSERKMCLDIRETASNALDEMLKISLQVQRNIENMNPSLLFDLRKYHFSIWQHFENYRKDFILNLMLENLGKGKKEGIYRAELNADIIARVHIGTIEIFADDELLPPDAFPRPLVHREFVLYHLHGIVSDLGRGLLDKYLKQTETNINL